MSSLCAPCGCRRRDADGLESPLPKGATRATWDYVGHGRGGYEKVETYQYAGDGQGDYEREHAFTYPDGGLIDGARCRTIGLAVLVIIVSAVGIFMVYSDRGADEDAGHAAASAHSHRRGHARGHALGARPTAPEVAPALAVPPAQALEDSRPSYDCSPRGGLAGDGDAAQLPAGWAEARDPQGKRYYYNQDGGVQQWARPGGGEAHGWSEDQAAWCCERKQIGCASTTTTSTTTAATSQPSTTTDSKLPFDCLAGFGMWKTSWSAKKQEFCCANFSRGCPDASTTASKTHSESPGYDCEASYRDWKTKWSKEQQVWCCTYSGRGCASDPTPPTEERPSVRAGEPEPEDSDDSEDSDGREQAQDAAVVTHPLHEKRSEERPATTAAPSTAVNTTAAPSTAVTTTSEAHDCSTASPRWEQEWSAKKKHWCCKNALIGCPTSSAAHSSTTPASTSSAARRPSTTAPSSNSSAKDSEPATYDCLETTTDYNWSMGKLEYCCDTHHICIDELSQPPRSSSHAEKSIASKVRTTQGKADRIDVGAADFDCTDLEKGYGRGKGAWPLEQKKWCCEEQGACPTTSYDCQAGYNNWKEGWSEAKQKWCCASEVRGCK